MCGFLKSYYVVVSSLAGRWKTRLLASKWDFQGSSKNCSTMKSKSHANRLPQSGGQKELFSSLLGVLRSFPNAAFKNASHALTVGDVSRFFSGPISP
jgi:hypothetical protein